MSGGVDLEWIGELKKQCKGPRPAFKSIRGCTQEYRPEVSGLAFYFRHGSIDGGVIKMENFKHAIGRGQASTFFGLPGMAVFTAAHGTPDSCSILLLRLRSDRGRGRGRGNGRGSRAGELESWRAASPKIIILFIICWPLVSCAVWHQSLQHPGAGRRWWIVEGSRFSSTGHQRCVNGREGWKKQKADATRKAEGTTLNGSLATNDIVHLSSLPQPESKAGWTGLSIRQIESETSRRRGHSLATL